MINLTVKTLDSQNHAFSLEDDQITVRGFKEHIAESVAVPADSQRLIYCGRVLQDDKKLNEYDVNGKVIHLVQRAPPQIRQRGNDSNQGQDQEQGQGWQNSHRQHFRLGRAQMHGNAMYLGAMPVPPEFMEGHAQLSNSLSSSRLVVARRMLNRVNELMDRLDDPNSPITSTTSENNQTEAEQIHVQEVETGLQDNAEGVTNGGRLAEAAAAAAAIAAALSAAGATNVTVVRENEEGPETRPPTDSTENQSDQQQQQSQGEQGTASNSEGQNRRRLEVPRPPQMAELLDTLRHTQNRMGRYMQWYQTLMQTDPTFDESRTGPDSVEQSQRIIDGVSESLHYMAHACHALSDIIVDMRQQPPRNLQCRPIIIQHSAILQAGIPIQVEAHISLHGRNANNNNGTEEGQVPIVVPRVVAPLAVPEDTEIAENAQQTEPTDSAAQTQEEPPQQEQNPSSFGTVFNLPNNVEVLMEVSPERPAQSDSGSDQPPTTENNNNNAGGFPWGSAPPRDFMRSIMHAVAGHMVQAGIRTHTGTIRIPTTTIVTVQQPVSSMDSASTNAGQSTQARSNVGTHPTTATQTRSTSRPHVIHHHHIHEHHHQPVALPVGMSSLLEFDPFLLCHSHHLRRQQSGTPNANNTQARSTQTAEESSAQEPGTFTTPRNTETLSREISDDHPFADLMRDLLTQSPQIVTFNGVETNGRTVANLLHLLGRNVTRNTNGTGSGSAGGNSDGNASGNANGSEYGNVHVGFVGNLAYSDTERAFTIADLLEFGGFSMDFLVSGREENFLMDLFIVVAQNMTLDGLRRFQAGQSEPIAQLRRPLQNFFRYSIPNAPTVEAIQDQATERFLSQLRPQFQNLITAEESSGARNGSRIDISATIESLFSQYTREALRMLYDSQVDDAAFGRGVFTIMSILGKTLCVVVRYFVCGGQAGLEAVASRFISELLDGIHPSLRQWLLNRFMSSLRVYSLRLAQPADSEIVPLLVYKNPSPQPPTSAPSSEPQEEQNEVETMETEVVETKTVTANDASVQDEKMEDIPETFPGHEALPSDWVPIIARDGVRQRRQLQLQATTGVTPFSDAYLGGLPSKRRKLIEQQKPRLLVSPPPNHSAITASMERLVREGVGHAGIEEVEGAAVAVAADPRVRRAFGQAIRDCLNPHQCNTPDFPDPLRFPNATKYFADQERPPK